MDDFITVGAAIVFVLSFAALGLDSFLTRICPDCGSICERDASGKRESGVKLYRCPACDAYLLGSKPRHRKNTRQ